VRLAALRVDPAEQLLRRLALNDEGAVTSLLSDGAAGAAKRPTKVDLLVRLGALIALGAASPSIRRTVELARGAGATEEELVGVLIAVAPVVGLARVVAAAPRLAASMGYETDDVAW
jgi:4-carboxymuconolactone decarboxylase